MTTLETPLVNDIREALYREYPRAWVLKVHGSPFQASGTPDLICCVNGRFVALEVKHPFARAENRDATLAQRITLKKIAVAGGWGAVVQSVDQAMAVVRKAVDKKEEENG